MTHGFGLPRIWAGDAGGSGEGAGKARGFSLKDRGVEGVVGTGARIISPMVTLAWAGRAGGQGIG